jgi:hypothetical protein
MTILRPLVITAVLIAAVAVGIWGTLWLHSWESYEKIRSLMASGLLVVKPMNAEATELTEKVQSQWKRSFDQFNGPSSQSLQMIGLTPSVDSLVALLTEPMPPYSVWSPSQNERWAVRGMVFVQLMPINMDGAIYVSDDRRLAMIRGSKDYVFLFHDETEGLRETNYADPLAVEEAAKRKRAAEKTPQP